MLVRTNWLPTNQSAGWLDERPLRTVHHRPPKKIAPSRTPTTNGRIRVKASFMVFLRFLAHCLVFLGDPMPGIHTTDDQADDQQCQRPGMVSWMMFVQPD